MLYVFAVGTKIILNVLKICFPSPKLLSYVGFPLSQYMYVRLVVPKRA